MPLRLAKRFLRRTLNRFGYDVTVYNPEHVPDDADLHEENTETGLFTTVQPYTMTSMANVSALCAAVRYVETAGIDGAIVECGVWKGGSTMAAALQLSRLGSQNRDIYLFDTFDGLPEPGEYDIPRGGQPVTDALQRHADATGKACRSPLHEVRDNLAKTDYPAERLHFIQGMVEETVPSQAPEEIAILRLDTDFYESTKHELEHLFPRLKIGGVLIIDDYGYWRGARKATDDYFAAHNLNVLLCRIDHGARIAVKVP